MGELVEVGRWPLVIVRWPAHAATAEEVEQVIADLTTCYGRPHAVLHDGIRSGGLDATQRQRLAAHTAKYEDEIRRWVIASAAVAPSPLLRGVITAINWFVPPPCPMKVFAEIAPAEEWLMQALRRAGHRP